MSYLNFSKMITPKILVVLYWLGAATITLSGLAVCFMPSFTPLYSRTSGIDAINFVIGVAIIVIGNIDWRILCEYLIVQFKILDNVKEINEFMHENVHNEMKNNPSPPQTPPSTLLSSELLSSRKPSVTEEQNPTPQPSIHLTNSAPEISTKTPPIANIKTSSTTFFCSYCGTSISTDSKYCRACGKEQIIANPVDFTRQSTPVTLNSLNNPETWKKIKSKSETINSGKVREGIIYIVLGIAVAILSYVQYVVQVFSLSYILFIALSPLALIMIIYGFYFIYRNRYAK
jgi:hypothetical protein